MPYYPTFNQGWPNITPAPAQPYQTQSYAPAPQQPVQGILWVDGEVGAKAYQMPHNWPVGTPIPLWDTNDTIIYLKSINQMGMPNPLQKIHYTMEEQQNKAVLPTNQVSGADRTEYVTKEDFEQMKNEIKEMIKNTQSISGQNGSNQGNNRGGNR